VDAEDAARRIGALLRAAEHDRMKAAGGYLERCRELCPGIQTRIDRRLGAVDDAVRISWRAAVGKEVYAGHLDVSLRDMVVANNRGSYTLFMDEAATRLFADAWEVLAVAVGAMPPRGAP
jgi:hypothetical protein